MSTSCIKLFEKEIRKPTFFYPLLIQFNNINLDQIIELGFDSDHGLYYLTHYYLNIKNIKSIYENEKWHFKNSIEFQQYHINKLITKFINYENCSYQEFLNLIKNKKKESIFNSIYSFDNIMNYISSCVDKKSKILFETEIYKHCS